MKNKFLVEMNSRGYLGQCTNLNKLSEICDKKPISAYIGFDCTAKSLHVGSLLQIMLLSEKKILLTTMLVEWVGTTATLLLLAQEMVVIAQKLQCLHI